MDKITCEIMANSIPEGILVVDVSCCITVFNDTASNITGWSSDEVIGKKCWDFLHSPQCWKKYKDSETLDEPCNCTVSQVLIKTKDGQAVPIRISSRPLKNAQGKIIGKLIIFSDQRPLYSTNFSKFQQMGIVGRCKPMREVFQLVETVAETDSNVLIIGKTGTGKELVANAIHRLGIRKDKPFIKVNCAALSDSLLESELFGHEKGAFTGAIAKRVGRFEMADGGTIFLDEVAEITPKFQAKLLRVIQEGEFERVGSSRTQKVDVRIIAATNKDLKNMVNKNLFRDDLFYRINVFPIYLPEIKERKEDLKDLIDFFINKFNKRFNKQIRSISDEAYSILKSYDFPGNVRELSNIIEYTFIKSEGAVIEVENLPGFLLQKGNKTSLNRVVQKSEVSYICQVIEECGGNKSKAAKVLGISRKTLYNKLGTGFYEESNDNEKDYCTGKNE